MPDQASLGAGVLQTAMRLSISMGLAITAAVYGTTSHTPRGITDIDFPYERAYLCTILFAVVGFLFVTFTRIGKLGGNTDTEKKSVAICERPRTAGEYSVMSSERRGSGSCNSQRDCQYDFGSTILSVDTLATTGRQVSFFPRWSWENKHLWKSHRFRESNIVCEVCIKCLEERKVVVQDNVGYNARWKQIPGEEREWVREQEEVETGETRPPGDLSQSRREAEETNPSWARLLEERNRSRRDAEIERSWRRLPDEVSQSRREPQVEPGWTRLPDERTPPRRQVERAWQRFPVKPSARDIETGNVSKGGHGWL